MSSLYKILTSAGTIESKKPGTHAGYKRLRIFGRLDCASGILMKKENRVFFHSLEDAVRCNYRPCQSCKPMRWEAFEEMRERLGLGPYIGWKPKNPY